MMVVSRYCLVSHNVDYTEDEVEAVEAVVVEVATNVMAAGNDEIHPNFDSLPMI